MTRNPVETGVSPQRKDFRARGDNMLSMSALPTADGREFHSSGNKSEVVFLKSSLSSYNGSCVEIGTNERLRLIRDSKNPNGGMLSVSPKALKALLKSIKQGKFKN